jgi:hypothetical protein
MFAGVLALYLFLPTKNYFWDGVDFAQNIEDATRLNSSLFHPNHLLYNPFGYIIYRAFQGIGINLRALEVLQITNSVLSVFSAYLLFRILNQTLRSTYLSYVLTLLFSLSATWWKYSTDANSYIASVLLLIISFYYLLPDRKPRPLLAALFYSASMMFHQMAVFFFPALLAGVFLQARGLSSRRRTLLLIQSGVASFLLTILTYYYSFYLQTGRTDFRTFFRWTTSLSPEPGHTFSVWGNLVYTVNGHVKLFTSGRILFLKDSLDYRTIALLAVLLMLVVVLLWKLLRNFGEIKTFMATALRRDGRFKSLRILCAVWVASFFIFQYFFIPQHTYYRLFYLPALLVLIGTYLTRYDDAAHERRRRYRAALLVAAIAVSNLIFYILPLAQVKNYPPLAVALKLNEAWPRGTTVFFASRNSDNSLVRYFNPGVVWIEVNQETIEGEARNLQKDSSAWMETSLITLYQATPEGQRWLEAHTERQPEYEFINDKYRLQFYRLKPDSFNLPRETPSP